MQWSRRRSAGTFLESHSIEGSGRGSGQKSRYEWSVFLARDFHDFQHPVSRATHCFFNFSGSREVGEVRILLLLQISKKVAIEQTAYCFAPAQPGIGTSHFSTF